MDNDKEKDMELQALCLKTDSSPDLRAMRPLALTNVRLCWQRVGLVMEMGALSGQRLPELQPLSATMALLKDLRQKSENRFLLTPPCTLNFLVTNFISFPCCVLVYLLYILQNPCLPLSLSYSSSSTSSCLSSLRSLSSS